MKQNLEIFCKLSLEAIFVQKSLNKLRLSSCNVFKITQSRHSKDLFWIIAIFMN